jgi:sulfide dehydrogenase cytochrome subunit
MKMGLCVAVWTALALASTSALAQSAQSAPVDRQARVWAATCAACHGTDGRSVEPSLVTIAGRNADELYNTLLAFKNGQRPATVMHQHTKGYTDPELRRLANYFAAQSPR